VAFICGWRSSREDVMQLFLPIWLLSLVFWSGWYRSASVSGLIVAIDVLGMWVCEMTMVEREMFAVC
jgi:hypothetical protein